MTDTPLIISCLNETVDFKGLTLPCRIGKAGFVDGMLGREGDAKTPLGEYHLRFGLYRADRLPAPHTPLAFWPIEKNDGWCDAADDLAYNRFIRLPYPASHEALWREDGAYDLILALSHNDSPPEPDKGSAVFVHVAQPDDRKTLGCVALTPDDMIKLLPHLTPDMTVIIQP